MMKKIMIGVLCVTIVLIGVVYWYTSIAFQLNISANQATFNEGEDIELTITFENNSGMELLIDHGAFIAYYYVEDNDYYDGNRNVPTVMSTVPKGKLTSTVTMGSMLEKGTHSLIAVAEFYGIKIESNTILLTVI